MPRPLINLTTKADREQAALGFEIVDEQRAV